MSNSRRQRHLELRRGFDEEQMSLDSLHSAERLFAKLAVRALLREAIEPESAGLRLHHRDGRALTPQESGPARSEREHGYGQDDYSTDGQSTG